MAPRHAMAGDGRRSKESSDDSRPYGYCATLDDKQLQLLAIIVRSPAHFSALSD
jgi:hypothetical protein